MKGSKIVFAIIAAFITRAALNSLWYGVIRAGSFKALLAAHPGLFRDSINNPTPFIIGDLLACIAIVLLLSRVATGLGGGATAGVKLGIFLAILGPVIGSIYEYFSFAFMTPSLPIVDGAYQIVAYGITGAVAGAVLGRGTGQARAASA
jgi:hypothetical protein